jgi:hypothetical protein
MERGDPISRKCCVAPKPVVSRHVSGAQAYNIAMKTGMDFSGKIKKATAGPPFEEF